MKEPVYIKNRLIELRRLEQAARLDFDEAKNRLLKIKTQISQIEQLLSAPQPSKNNQ